jgi:hypothetical protein
MHSRYLDHTPTTTRGKADRKDYLWASAGVFALLLAIGVAWQFFSYEEPRLIDAEHGFGRLTRVGSLVFFPPVGDICRHSAFYNDHGAIVPLNDALCSEITGSLGPNGPTGPSNFDVISAKFRK